MFLNTGDSMTILDINNFQIKLDQPFEAKIAAPSHAKTFDEGRFLKAVGEPQKTNVKELDELGFKRHYVLGDGSCWARSLWQCVFAQVFSSEDKFNEFIKQIENPKPNYDIPKELSQKAHYALLQLKDKSPEERIQYLNHAAVDDVLIFYMRHVAAEYMRNNFAIYSDNELTEIKKDKNKYGGPEIIAFLKYFDLSRHAVVKKEDGNWYYYEDKKDIHNVFLVKNLKEHLDLLPPYCMFGANDIHFEFLSFDKALVSTSTITPQKMNDCLDLIAAQIVEDHEMAEKLQKKFDEEAKEIMKIEHGDALSAKELQEKLLKELEAKADDTQKTIETDCQLPKKLDLEDNQIDNKSVKDFFVRISNSLVQKITSVWNSVVSFFKSSYKKVKNSISNAYRKICNTFTYIKTTASDFLSNLFKKKTASVAMNKLPT